MHQQDWDEESVCYSKWKQRLFSLGGVCLRALETINQWWRSGNLTVLIKIVKNDLFFDLHDGMSIDLEENGQIMLPKSVAINRKSIASGQLKLVSKSSKRWKINTFDYLKATSLFKYRKLLITRNCVWLLKVHSDSML